MVDKSCNHALVRNATHSGCLLWEENTIVTTLVTLVVLPRHAMSGRGKSRRGDHLNPGCISTWVRNTRWTHSWTCSSPGCGISIDCYNAAQSHVSRKHRGKDNVLDALHAWHAQHRVQILCAPVCVSAAPVQAQPASQPAAASCAGAWTAADMDVFLNDTAATARAIEQLSSAVAARRVCGSGATRSPRFVGEGRAILS